MKIKRTDDEQARLEARVDAAYDAAAAILELHGGDTDTAFTAWEKIYSGAARLWQVRQ